jgi:hypothetical protein
VELVRRYVVAPVPELKKSKRRGLAFITCDDDSTLNAAAAFAGLDKNTERKVRDRFDFWIDEGINDNYFHGWPNDPRNKECFSFRWNYRRQRHRFYGFLHHPTPKTNAGFLLCVLVSHAIKNDWNTDPRQLGRANALRVDPFVLAAIMMTFSDERQACLN